VKINAEQLDALALVAQEQYEARVIAFLRERFEDAAATASDPEADREMREGVREQMARAEAHGFNTERQAAAWVTTAWVLGADFDTSMPYLHEVIASPDLDADGKAEAMLRHTEQLIRTLQGDP
jgi:hypothetical protein